MTLRQIVLDTETTGLTVEDGHRIIEVGCIEIFNRRITGRTLHFYLNPERAIDAGAVAVHGLTEERLRDEPKFADMVERLVEFVDGAELLIHNASFDMAFLDAEMARVGRPSMRNRVAGVRDTLAMARELHPGKRNSLDALCERYGVSNAHRKLHGALLDAELLADVFLCMTRGQDSLDMALHAQTSSSAGAVGDDAWPPPTLLVLCADASEQAAHAAMLQSIAKEAKRPALWSAYAEQPAA